MSITDFILDASITLSWCFEDEASPYADALLDRLSHVTAFVPKIWELEVSNVLLMAEKRKRITFLGIQTFLELLTGLNIQMMTEPDFQTFSTPLHLARQEGLTSYDASYLDLAIRKKLPLATKDMALQKAAIRHGVFYSTE